METVIEKVLYLQNLELFKDVPSEQLSYLASISASFTAEKGEVLYREGEASESLYMIVDGNVRLLREEDISKEVDDQMAIGVWGFFDEKPHMYTAICSEPTHLLKIDSSEFFDLMENQIYLSRGVLKYFVRRIRTLIDATDTII